MESVKHKRERIYLWLYSQHNGIVVRMYDDTRANRKKHKLYTEPKQKCVHHRFQGRNLSEMHSLSLSVRPLVLCVIPLLGSLFSLVYTTTLNTFFFTNCFSHRLHVAGGGDDAGQLRARRLHRRQRGQRVHRDVSGKRRRQIILELGQSFQ